MPRTLNILSAGAAQGLLKALQPGFEQLHDCRIQGRFGAVGAMKEALLAGEPCDLMVLSSSLVDEQVAAGRLRGDACAALGRVRTGIAVPRGRAHPGLATAHALRAALLAADALYFPDPQRATAGIHFVRVLDSLEVHTALQARLRPFANGATAMAELARCGLPGAIGCTQVTEILYTAGVELVALLPAQFELATTYSAALVVGAPGADLAAELLRTLIASEHRALRESGGFES